MGNEARQTRLKLASKISSTFSLKPSAKSELFRAFRTSDCVAKFQGVGTSLGSAAPLRRSAGACHAPPRGRLHEDLGGAGHGTAAVAGIGSRSNPSTSILDENQARVCQGVMFHGFSQEILFDPAFGFFLALKTSTIHSASFSKKNAVA